MQERWVRCPTCGHKLFKDRGRADVEIKCSSCKGIVTITGGVTVGYNGSYGKRADYNRRRNRSERDF